MSFRRLIGTGVRVLGAALACALAASSAAAQCNHGGSGMRPGGPSMFGGSPNPRMMQLMLMQRQLQQQQQLQLLQQQVRQKKQLDDLKREVGKKDPDELKQALRDPRPEMRYVAAQVVGEKMLPLSRELIELLTDDNALVRQSVRQSLVRLSKSTQKAPGELKSTARASRGVDFGPLPEANRAAQKIAARKWGEWLDRQQAKRADLKDDIAAAAK